MEWLIPAGIITALVVTYFVLMFWYPELIGISGKKAQEARDEQKEHGKQENE